MVRNAINLYTFVANLTLAAVAMQRGIRLEPTTQLNLTKETRAVITYSRVYLRLMLCLPCGILGITMERCCRLFGDELSECRCDVSAFDLQRSMRRPSKIDDRCVDL